LLLVNVVTTRELSSDRRRRHRWRKPWQNKRGQKNDVMILVFSIVPFLGSDSMIAVDKKYALGMKNSRGAPVLAGRSIMTRRGEEAKR
jgi:hypothetical protein